MSEKKIKTKIIDISAIFYHGKIDRCSPGPHLEGSQFHPWKHSQDDLIIFQRLLTLGDQNLNTGISGDNAQALTP